MNTPEEDDDDIERILRRMAPTPPDAALMGRLQRAAPGRSRIVSFLCWSVPLAAAAVIVALMAMRSSVPRQNHGIAKKSDPVTPSTKNFVKIPIESRQHLMEVTDLGVVTRGRQPVRLIRTTWVDEILYQTGPGNEPLKEGRIRQEVVPVALPSY